VYDKIVMKNTAIYKQISAVIKKATAWLKGLKGWNRAVVIFVAIILIPLWPIYFGLFAYWLLKKFIKSEKLLKVARVAIIIYMVVFALPVAVIGAINLVAPIYPSEYQPPMPSESAVPQLKPLEKTQKAESTLYDVVKVVDGDTVDVNIDGKTERIRLIGLDTPETVDPRKTVQCFGQEASTKAHELLDGKKVTLEADATQGERDTYGRLLRYIMIEGGNDFSKTMIENGYGHEYTYQIPYKRQNEYKEAQKSAENGKKGLWADNTCAGTTTAVAPAPAVTTPAAAPVVSTPKVTAPVQTNTGCLIKGNISSGGHIYHVPGGAYYDQTSIDTSAGERWFCTEAEAVAAGWRASLR